MSKGAIACEYKPSVYLEVPTKDILEDLSVGQTVEVVVRGKITMLSSSTSEYDGKKEERNEMRLEDYKVKLADVGKWKSLSEDD